MNNYIIPPSQLHLLYKDVIFLFGAPCSGKDTFAKQLEQGGYTILQTSTYVKKLASTTDTKELLKSSHLDDKVASIMADDMLDALIYGKKVCIVGIRSLKILTYLYNMINTKAVEISFSFIILDTDYSTMVERFNARQRPEDATLTSYQEVLDGALKMGYNKILQFIQTPSLKDHLIQIHSK